MRRVVLIVVLALLLAVMGGANKRPGTYKQGETDWWATGTGSTGGAVVVDTFTIVFCYNDTTDHYYAEYDSLVNGSAAVRADSIVDLSGLDSFAWAFIDSAHATTSAIDRAPASSQHHQMARLGTHYNNVTDLVSTSSGVVLMQYFPFEDYIPKNATVLDAEMCIYPQNLYFSGEDTVVSTVMNNPSDSVWRTSKHYRETYEIGEFLNYAHPSWSYQILGRDDAGTVLHYPEGASSNPWVPALSERLNLYDWGSVFDGTGHTDATQATPFSGAEGPFRMPLKNCVQEIANRGEHQGIATVIFDYASNTSYDWPMWEMRDGYTFANKKPWVKVTYSTKKHRADWPDNSRFVFLFSTDDFRPINTTWSRMFAEYGWNYTIFVAEVQISGNEPDSLVYCRDLGMEVGSHSRTHPYPGGVHTYTNAATYTGALTATGFEACMALIDTSSLSTNDDRVLFEVDRCWLYEMFDSVRDEDWQSDNLVGKSFAYPVTTYPDGPLMDALHNERYKVWRSTGMEDHDLADGGKHYGAAPQTAGGACDTASIGFDPKFDRDFPQNMRAVTFTHSIQSLVGDRADSSVTEAEVKANVRRAVQDCMSRGQGVFSTFVHDRKGSLLGYSEGLDTEELEWILEVVDEMGGTAISHVEYYDWITSRADPVATPAGFGQSNYYRWADSDSVWWKPWRVWYDE
jgi:hypothetical protein